MKKNGVNFPIPLADTVPAAVALIREIRLQASGDYNDYRVPRSALIFHIECTVKRKGEYGLKSRTRPPSLPRVSSASVKCS